MGLFLLWLGMSCWQEQLSKFTVAVTLLLPLFKVLQLQQALRKPSAGLTWAAGGPQRREWALFELADTPLSGNFCCLCRKASGGGSGGAAVILWAGRAFSSSPPFQETHFVVSSLCVCKRREGVKAKGHGAVGLNDSSTVRGWMCSDLKRVVYQLFHHAWVDFWWSFI